MGFDLSGTNGVIVRAISPPRWYGGSFSYKWYDRLDKDFRRGGE
jgi:hypothetical protein